MTERWWNGARLAELKRLWAEGHTCAVIGKKMECSPAAVTSARSFYGLPARRIVRNVGMSGKRKAKAHKPRLPVEIVEKDGWPSKSQLMAGR